MGKKLVKTNSQKNKHLTHQKSLNSKELKAYALKKVHQRQNKKNQLSKISKNNFSVISVQKKSLKVQKQTFDQIIDESAFQCPVCLQLMIEPTLLQCGHAYCAKCIQQLMIYKSNCGVCRNVQKEPQFQHSKYLETLIEKIVLQKSSNYLDYYCRVTDSQNWKKARNISVQQLNKGSFVDFRDCELKWRKGEISKIFYDQKLSTYQIEIKYKKQKETVTETINSVSSRYAKFTYYTRMKYLQPKTNCQLIQNRISDQILYTPLTNSFRDFFNQIDQSLDQEIQETIGSVLQQNNDQRSQLPYIQYQESQFLNEIFGQQVPQGNDFIELLA